MPDLMGAVRWYGMGAFGLPMACRCIDCGRTVRAGNGRGRIDEFVRAGGLPYTAKVQGPQLVGLCLPSAVEVMDVLQDLDDDVACVVDFSSHDPLSANRAAELLSHRGIGYVDCPVSGSLELAGKGQLTGYVGAREGDLTEDVLALVNTVCERVFWTGALGQGQAMKLVNQVIHLGNVLVLGEGFELADEFGLEPAMVLSALKASSASSRMLERFGQQMMDDVYPRQFSVQLAHKDIRNALQLMPGLPIATMVAERLRAAVVSGHGEENFTRLARHRQGSEVNRTGPWRTVAS